MKKAICCLITGVLLWVLSIYNFFYIMEGGWIAFITSVIVGFYALFFLHGFIHFLKNSDD